MFTRWTPYQFSCLITYSVFWMIKVWLIGDCNICALIFRRERLMMQLLNPNEFVYTHFTTAQIMFFLHRQSDYVMVVGLLFIQLVAIFACKLSSVCFAPSHIVSFRCGTNIRPRSRRSFNCIFARDLLVRELLSVESWMHTNIQNFYWFANVLYN